MIHLQTVAATLKALWLKFATRTLAFVCAAKDMVDHAVTNVCPASTAIPTVCPATVPTPALFRPFVTRAVDVLVYQTLAVDSVLHARLVTISTLIAWPAAVTLTARLVFRVTRRDSASAPITLMASGAMSVSSLSLTFLRGGLLLKCFFYRQGRLL